MSMCKRQQEQARAIKSKEQERSKVRRSESESEKRVMKVRREWEQGESDESDEKARMREVGWLKKKLKRCPKSCWCGRKSYWVVHRNKDTHVWMHGCFLVPDVDTYGGSRYHGSLWPEDRCKIVTN
jgi:hypothetical protein